MSSSNPNLLSTLIRVGVIGTGYRISNVLRALREHAPQLVITAICDPDPDAFAAFRRTFAPGSSCDLNLTKHWFSTTAVSFTVTGAF